MAQKMLLVPETSVLQKQHTQPIRNRVSRLDTEIGEILERDLPDDEKLKRYSATLDRFLGYFSQLQSRPEEKRVEEKKTIKSEEDIERILRELPKFVQKKARGILERIRDSDEFDWNHRGRFLRNQEEVPDTNIVDLLRDVLIKQHNPPGAAGFHTALSQMNVPRSFLLSPAQTAKRELSPPPYESRKRKASGRQRRQELKLFEYTQ